MAAKNTLTDKAVLAAIKTAKTTGKTKKVSDGGRLMLECTPGGSALWRMRYFRGDKETMLPLGTYPATSLAAARLKRDAAATLLESGIDPVEHRNAEKAAVLARAEAERLAADGKPMPGTFEFVAREWVEQVHRTKVSAVHADRTLRRFELDAFPWVGRVPIAELDAPALLTVLRRVTERGSIETAHRLKDSCGQVFRYAIGTGQAKRDWAADLKDALPAVESRNHAAFTDPDRFSGLLRDMAAYKGHTLTRAALSLSALLMLRPGNVRALEWAWVDMDCAMLTIPSAGMKGTRKAKASGVPFEVPLSRQALAVLAELRMLTGSGRYVFRGARDPKQCMSDGTVLGALRRMGYTTDDVTAHGFRASARTMAAKRLGIRADVLEEALAHGKGDAHGGAYDRTEWLSERVDAMQKWADYVDRLRDGSNVVQLKGAA